jgi:hypothetical protein
MKGIVNIKREGEKAILINKSTEIEEEEELKIY